eukprot:NODE_3466_length_2031_cov_5.348739.p1 GENE.NODE_3466_length_2031_cov_5.348739~~NODE_3466_length_2031_cov_5.348739.p1  ORF type:complete len:674 (+),score=238.71 NODE_3466_length_2031_cov_5.348739:179-2023(+)
MSDKFKRSDTASQDMQQTRQHSIDVEAELDSARRENEELKKQIAQITNDEGVSRQDSLDQLRTDLMQRIDRPVARVVVPEPAAAEPPPIPENGDDRKTLMNQRAMFESLKQQFNDMKGPIKVEETIVEAGDKEREMELEEQLRQVAKDNVDLTIRIQSLEEDGQEKATEANQLRNKSGILQAEIDDLKFQIEQEVGAARRMEKEHWNLQEKIKEMDADTVAMRRRNTAVEDRLVQSEEDHRATKLKYQRIDDDREAAEQHARELQRQVLEAQASIRQLDIQVEEHREVAERRHVQMEATERQRAAGEGQLRALETENERLRIELESSKSERAKINQVVDDLMKAEGKNRREEVENLEAQLEKMKQRATHFEREYTNSKQLNNEMTKVMSQMTTAVSARSEETGDVTKQNRTLVKTIELKNQELRNLRFEKDEVQKQFDSLQSMGSYFQEKYKEVANELRQLKQEHSISAATSSKLKTRVELLQKESEDLKGENTKLITEVSIRPVNTAYQEKIDTYEAHMRELQQKILRKDEEMEHSQACFAKSQIVNDCLSTLLSLESDQTNIYETCAAINDESARLEIKAKKSKAQAVIGRLNNMRDDDSPGMMNSIGSRRG